MEPTVDAFAGTSWTRTRLEELAGTVPSPAHSPTDDGTIQVSAPATDEVIGAIPRCNADDVEGAVSRARGAARAWRERPAEERATVLERFAERVSRDEAALLDLLQLETGKSRRDALEEALDVSLTAEYYADTAAGVLAPESRKSGLPGFTTAEVQYEPVGIVGVISPWNYPMNLSMTDLLPALAAGNGVVLKPDDKTPFVALRLAALLRESGLPTDLLHVVTGDPEVVGPAVIDEVDYLAFTGGTETGRVVAEHAGRNLVDCSLELGGKNPFVVLTDADPETAARGAVKAAFTNAGQLCLAAERIYVEGDRYDEFLDAFVGKTRSLSLGTGYSYEDQIGSLIGPAQLERVESHVEDAVDRGATVLTGGRRRPDVGPYVYEPTILTDVPEDALAYNEETFGPVVRVERVPSADAAVERANDSPYGLQASVWTDDRKRGVSIAERIDCGTVCVNDAYTAGWSAHDAPMGGFDDSGIGRRHGPEGMRRFLEPKTIAVSRIGPIDTPSWLPDRFYARGLSAVSTARRRLSAFRRGIRRWWR